MLNLNELDELVAFWSSKYQMLLDKLFVILLQHLILKKIKRNRQREREGRDLILIKIRLI